MSSPQRPIERRRQKRRRFKKEMEYLRKKLEQEAAEQPAQVAK